MNRTVTLLLGLFFVVNTSFAHKSETPSSIEHIPLEQISKHIYVVHGTQELPNPNSRGFMNNPAAIFTGNGIIIVDPGSSVEIGKQLLKKVRKVSDKPVIAVFNTHVHGDHWLGNHGIRLSYPKVPIYAHERMIKRVDDGEGEYWIDLLMKMTKNAVAGTSVISPNIGLKGGETLTINGVKLRIHHAGHAHTDHDIMIEVIDDKVLFFGDIVAAKRVPNSDVPQDANFKGTIMAIKAMLKGEATYFVPGHGRSGDINTPKASLHFLEKLYDSVTKYYHEGLENYEMKDKIIMELTEYKDWNNFEELGRVITYVFQEVERENF